MRVVIQRVRKASVIIDENIFSSIKSGLVIFLGIENNDNDDDIEWLCNKLINLRIFNDDLGVMNLSLNDINGEILIISQFTLFASTKKGNRPSYSKALKADYAIPLYEKFIKKLEEAYGTDIKTGVFGADMKIDLINDGPVTIIMDTKNKE
jgi:D-tyrosyl-tRNA(Tyr) deacylase